MLAETIYLVDEDGTGTATANNERGARAFEMVGFHRVSREEYQRAQASGRRAERKVQTK